MRMLEADVSKKLKSFDLDVRFEVEGGCLGILGASGCGKSMTLKAVAGLVKPDQGQIRRDGQVLFDSARKIDVPPRKRQVGYLFQNYALFPTMTVEKNIAAGLEGSRTEKEARVREMAKKFQLEGLEKRLPGQLSGGQQQRVALARALANKPALILADEPTGNLDSGTTVEVMGLLKESSRKYNQTILMVTHNEALAQACDRIIRIEDGKLYDRKEQPKQAGAAGTSGTAGKGGDRS